MRQQEYRALFRAALGLDFVEDLRVATNRDWARGDTRLQRQIAKALCRRVAPLPNRRAAKTAVDVSSICSDPFL